MTSLDDEVSTIRNRWPDVKIDVNERDDKVMILSRIVVPDRGQGTGTEIMEHLIAYADRSGVTIGLTPSTDFGGTKSRLERFYRGFGFRPNKGSNRDLRIRESWVREPTAE